MTGGLRSTLFTGAILSVTIFSAAAPAQNQMLGLTNGGRVRLLSTDSAVLDTEDIKKDLPCTVSQIKPILGFDLRFHTRL